MRGRLITIGFLALALAVLVPQGVLAQSDVSTGQLFGTVTDPDGGVMPGATIEVKNTETGFVRRTVSDASGFFRVDLLPVGDYEVKATLAGFKTQVYRDVKIGLGSSARVDFALAISAVEEAVLVIHQHRAHRDHQPQHVVFGERRGDREPAAQRSRLHQLRSADAGCDLRRHERRPGRPRRPQRRRPRDPELVQHRRRQQPVELLR